MSGCAVMAPAPDRSPVSAPGPAPAMPPPALRPIEPPLAVPPFPPNLPPLAMAPIMLPPPTDAASLRARYGAPDFIRREPESELWRYDGANCAAFFFLYREGDALKLRYSETMPRGMGVAADPVCVESLSAHAGATS